LLKGGQLASEGKKQRADGQISGLAGEFFVAAELLKRGIQTSVTFGNAKSIDLLAHNSESGKTFTVQVKALRFRNFFPIAHSRVEANHVYVFVILNGPGQSVRYFIVRGSELARHPERFGDSFQATTFPGIKPAVLDKYEGNWAVFGIDG
jgi:hypothetical protein